MVHDLLHIELKPNLFEVIVPFEELAVTTEDIIQTLGYSVQQAPEYFREHVDTILAKAQGYCSIHAGYKIIPITFSSNRRGEVLVETTAFHTGPMIAAQLKKAQAAVLFLCTIGSGLEVWAKECDGHDDIMNSFFIDAAASLITERTAEVLHQSIRQTLSRYGIQTTNRYSPGYCGWPTSEQQLLFSFFPKNYCGISLTESSLMIPRKSISGLLGIGASVKFAQYACKHCTMPQCTYRIHLHKKTCLSTTNDKKVNVTYD